MSTPLPPNSFWKICNGVRLDYCVLVFTWRHRALKWKTIGGKASAMQSGELGKRNQHWFPPTGRLDTCLLRLFVLQSDILLQRMVIEVKGSSAAPIHRASMLSTAIVIQQEMGRFQASCLCSHINHIIAATVARRELLKRSEGILQHS